MQSLPIAAKGYVPGGNPYKIILRLALPTVIAMLSQSVVNEIDIVFFSHLPCPESSNGQAALLPSLIVLWLFGGSLSAVSVGTQALVSRRYAEGHRDAAGAVLANGAWFCLVAGAVWSTIGFLLVPFLLRKIIAVPEVQDVAISYTRWRLFGVISMGMTMAVKAFFDGIGRTHIHLISAIVMNAANVFLCWMFIFGNLGAPRMGVTGAGVAGFASTWVGLLIMLGFAWALRGDYMPARWGNLSRKLTWDILKLSIPAAIATVIMMVGFGVFAKVVGKLDAPSGAAVAAVAGQCGGSEPVNSAATMDIVAVLKLTFTACMAFGTATATLVAQSLGRREPEVAQKFGWASVRLGVLIFGVVGLAEGVLFTPQIVNLVTSSEAVREAAMVPMRMMGIATPLIAVAMILSEALFGAGAPRFVALAQFLLIFGIMVPGAYVFGVVMHLGLFGIWLAATLYSVVAAITMSVKFAGGAWKTIKL